MKEIGFLLAMYVGFIFIFLLCALQLFWGFPCGPAGKESACTVGDLGLLPGLGRSPGEGKGYPLQYSGLDRSMNSVIHGVTKKSDMTEQLSLTHSLQLFYFD